MAIGTHDDVEETPSSKEGAPRQSLLPPADLAGEIEELRSQLRQERDRYVRLLADFANYRRHAEREGSKQAEAGKREIILPLLSILDDLERALHWAGSGEQSLADGVRLVHRGLLALLENQGVRPFDSVGKTFTPERHEAVAVSRKRNVVSGTITEELRRGYLWKDELLRPAQVRVAS